MNSIERLNATMIQRPPDKVPIRVGNYNVFLIHYYGISVREYLEDPTLNARLLVKLVEEFKLDSIKPGLGYILYGCGPEMGPTWEFPEDNFPAATRGIINNSDDLKRVIPPQNPEGYFKNFLEINRKVKAAIGQETHLGVSILGPYSVMAFLRGYDHLLMDMVEDQAFFKRLMQKGVEISTYIGRHCMDLELHWANLMEIFLIPGMINPDDYHHLIAPHSDAVCRKLSSPALPNSMSAFMGIPGDSMSYENGRLVYDYYFGIRESIGVLRAASQLIFPGFPRLVSLSGNALVHWSQDRILAFLRQGLDYYVKEMGEYPCIFLPSIQSENQKQSKQVAEKLIAINALRNAYSL